MADANPFSEDLSLAQGLAYEASRIALAHFETGLRAEEKPEGTAVTDADLAVERFLVAQLNARRPADRILGEELGAHGDGERRWILDPIDGTANFVAGRPDWGSHIALECEGEIVLGVISRPVVGRLWWAVRGGGAFTGSARTPDASPVPLGVSDTAALASSRVAVWAAPPHRTIDRVESAAVLAIADLDAILRLAEGTLDGVIDPTGRVWDHAPAVVIVEEAGGRFSDVEGGRRIDRGEGRYTNGRIHDALVELLDR